MEKMTYEQAIQRLEEIINSLENNEIAFEDTHCFISRRYCFITVL